MLVLNKKFLQSFCYMNHVIAVSGNCWQKFSKRKYNKVAKLKLVAFENVFNKQSIYFQAVFACDDGVATCRV